MTSRMTAVVLSILAIGSAEPASAKAPAGRFVVSADTMSVLDTKTKLTWQQRAPGGTYTWADAKTYCAATAASLGGTGWRLPTVKEIMSVLDYTQNSTPMFDGSLAQSSSLIYFWTGTPYKGSTTLVWIIDDYLGGTDRIAPTGTAAVRCVR